MTTLATEQIDLVGGLEATFTAAAASQQFVPTDRTFLEVVNGDASDHDITITTPGTGPGSTAIADLTVTVTAGERRHIGPFPKADWAGTDGLASIAWSATTSMTIAVLKV